MPDPVANIAEQRMQAFLQFRTELMSAREKSYEQFDSAILTLSSGGLGLSVAFLDNVVELETAGATWVLVGSWILFAVAILATMSSFLCSQAAIDRTIEHARAYYVDDDREALKRRNPFSIATRWLNLAAALFFLLAVSMTIVFVSINL